MIYPPPVQVRGEASGVAIVRQDVPDAGDMYHLRGRGRISPMGNVAVRGDLQTSSITGRPIGTVTIANRLGRVELRITDGPSPATPDAFHFEVASATGRYSQLEGTTGVLELRVGEPGPAGRARFEMDVNPFVILSQA
jgi:hypothetical protein